MRHPLAKMLRSYSAFAATAVSLALVSGESRADIYQYVDAEGVIHITNTETRGKRVATTPRSAPSWARDASPERFSRYDAIIAEAAALYQLPEALVRAVIKVESNYDAGAVSSAGACGLMQLMPGTAAGMHVTEIHDPRQNIFGGVRYLRVLANLFNGSLVLTVAAYNAGENAVMRHGGVPPYEETQQYVSKVLYWYQRMQASAQP